MEMYVICELWLLSDGLWPTRIVGLEPLHRAWVTGNHQSPQSATFILGKGGDSILFIYSFNFYNIIIPYLIIPFYPSFFHLRSYNAISS